LFKQGFDEYMNLVLDDAEEVNVKKKSKKTLGKINFSNLIIFVFTSYAFSDRCYCFD
jgi:uncharacterized protein YydD (DUF2326 family)